MVKLMPKSGKFKVKLEELVHLKDVIPAGAEAQRELNVENVESLILSDPTKWPPIDVTLTDFGYLIIDGHHREAAAKAKGLAGVEANCTGYQSEEAVIEATFRANLTHGLKSSVENRSAYAYWLHVTYPELEQEAIAKRAGVTQSTVSKAISRREAAAERATLRQAEPVQPSLDVKEPATEEQREQPTPPPPPIDEEKLERAFKSFARDAFKLFTFVGDVSGGDEQQLVGKMRGLITTDEDRERLTRVLRLLEEVLAPPKKGKGGHR